MIFNGYMVASLKANILTIKKRQFPHWKIRGVIFSNGMQCSEEKSTYASLWNFVIISGWDSSYIP